MNGKNKRKNGHMVIQMIAFVLLSLMIASLAVDVGYYFTAQNLLQSAADASSLAATQELFTNPSAIPTERQDSAKSEADSLANTYVLEQKTVDLDTTTDIQFGFIDPATYEYNEEAFTTPSADEDYLETGGYNATRIIVRKTEEGEAGALATVMSRLLGVDTMRTHAVSVAMMDQNISQVTTGLRPFYGCLAQFNAAMADGTATNNVARIFGNTMSLDGEPVEGCPENPDGNWGFADFRDAGARAPGADTLVDWILNGYPDAVITGDDYYSTQSGAEIANNNIRNALDSLISNQTVIMVPLTDSASGSGANTTFHVGGYAGFVITGYRATGPERDRFIEGYFTNIVCAENCNSGGLAGGGVAKLRLMR